MRLVWHRGDLRTHDHPALSAATEAGPVLGVVILDPTILGPASLRRRALFHRNVRALRRSYESRGGVLVVRHGEPGEELVRLADALGHVDRVHAIASYTPYGVYRDTAVVEALAHVGIGTRWHDGAYVHSPGTVRTAQNSFYSVFTPFYRRWRALGTPTPLDPPVRIPPPAMEAGFDPGDVPDYEPDVDLPVPGEEAALESLERFVLDGLDRYAERRDRLDGSGTSRLSTYITPGVLSARTAVARVEAAGGPGAEPWLRQVAWRDFMADLVYQRPDMVEQPFHPRWRKMEWTGGPDRFAAWREGRTGVPAVDAAMRELRETGWISGRARMVAAQFLAKNLQVDWRLGAGVFKEWLLDGDTASNTGNWQWVAGLGIDNAPYFRVMNPVEQGRRHDPEGGWLRRWAPGSGGDPAPGADAIVQPKPSRAEYLDAAGRVPPAERADPPPAPRSPALALATDAQLGSIPGIGNVTAAAVLDTLADGRHHPLESAAGVGPVLAAAIRQRFHV